MSDSPTFDRSVPVVLLKVGRYPFANGLLGAIRSLGQVGVPVWALCDDAWVPYRFSRYLTHPVVRLISPETPTEVIADFLNHLGQQTASRPILLATDDEAACIISESRADLCDTFRLPVGDPGLARRLSSKTSLSELCAEHRVPTPTVFRPSNRTELVDLAANSTFPLIAKSSDAFGRLSSPLARPTQILSTPDELLELTQNWTGPMGVVFQEYIPAQNGQDWIFSGYFDESTAPLVALTARKYRSWPPLNGPASAARSEPNEAVRKASIAFAASVGYHGPVDMDWRLDPRDGQYKLVDCNPRLGAAFAVMRTTEGMDIVRAAHLHLTGRKVPRGDQAGGRKLIVENADLLARTLGRRDQQALPHTRDHRLYAWFDPADINPFPAMVVRQAAKWIGSALHFSVVRVRDRVTPMIGHVRRRTTTSRSARSRLRSRSDS